MSATKNVFSALSDDPVPKQTQTQGKKKTKKKPIPLNLHEPVVPVSAPPAPRHALRTEMTEDEEFQAALEASKKEAERLQKAQVQQQWSSVTRQAASTHSTTANTQAQQGPVIIKPKATAAAQNTAATPKATSALPPRSPTNPWALNPIVPSKPANPSPTTTPATTTTTSSNATSNTTGHNKIPVDDEQFSDDDELVVVPLATTSRPSAPGSTPVKPIARPTHQEPAPAPNGISNIVVTSVLDSESSLQSRLSELHAHLPLSVTTSTSSSGVSSPVHSLPPTSSTHSTQQLQELLQQAILRIAKLEQSHDLLATRLSRVIEASAHLEQLVTTTNAENAALKTQVAEMRTKFLSAAPLIDANTLPYLSTGNAYGAFFNPQPYVAHAHPHHMSSTSTQQSMGSPHLQSLGMGNSLFGAPPTSMSQPSSATSQPQTSSQQQGLNSSGFASNGFLN